ncbi:MAG: hypothetical protein AAB677_01440 [Patescibacteria group bacterium]
MNLKNILAIIVIAVVVFLLASNKIGDRPLPIAISPSPNSISVLETQINSEGPVSVKVTPKLSAAVAFEITLDTHSEELTVDLTRAVTLRDETGREYPPLGWQGDPPGGHHREGLLTFGQLAPRPQTLQLTVRQIGGVAERKFKWMAAVTDEPPVPISTLISTEPAAELPVRWGDLGAKLVETGVIDGEKFEQLYAGRGNVELTAEIKKLLYRKDNGRLKITAANSGAILNLLWALGLATKNEILDTGPMRDQRYGGNVGGFASTGGWTLARGEAMAHYSQHSFFTLTPAQQRLVERVSQNIYRPCCDNSTYFPDCNHGMAMLGLLELMAAQNLTETDMYRVALTVNGYWFPDTYLTIDKYLKTQGSSLVQADPQEILGVNYSSGSGYRQIMAKMKPASGGSGTSCGI